MSTPSENQQQFSGGVGCLPSNLATFVIRHPSVTTFARVMSEANWPSARTKIFQLFGVYVGFLFLALCKATLTLSSQLGPGLTINYGAVLGILIFYAAIALVTLPLAFFATEGIWYLLARLFGGQGQFVRQCYTKLLYLIPLITINLLAAFILGFFPYGVLVYLPIGLAISVYTFALQVLATRAVYGLNTPKAIVVTCTPLVAYTLIIVFSGLLSPILNYYSSGLPHS